MAWNWRRSVRRRHQRRDIHRWLDRGLSGLAIALRMPVTLSPSALAVMLPGGDRHALRTTSRIYEQDSSDDSCCAHAVAAAMETWLVEQDQLDAASELLDPQLIFSAAKKKRNLHRCCEAAKAVPTANGIGRASTTFLGEQRIEQ